MNREPNNLSNNKEAFFSEICIDRCKGRCCDPWWGIIAYTIIKKDGLSRLNNFMDEVAKGIRERMERIRKRYVTNEGNIRRLFATPERYNVSIENISIKGNSTTITIRAMFAFRCQFLSPENICTIHPAIIGGEDIRPPHCGFMGSPDATPDSKGYCRIIHSAAGAPDDASVEDAINLEREVSDRFFNEGCSSIKGAAKKVVEQVKDYHLKHAQYQTPIERPQKLGRNEPCHCGSGKKYKRCHGGA